MCNLKIMNGWRFLKAFFVASVPCRGSYPFVCRILGKKTSKVYRLLNGIYLLIYFKYFMCKVVSPRSFSCNV